MDIQTDRERDIERGKATDSERGTERQTEIDI